MTTLHTSLLLCRQSPPCMLPSERLAFCHTKDSALAGHSFGEYSALISIADVLPLSSFVGVMFYREITEQPVVGRDLRNLFNHAMCAVNLSWISKPSITPPSGHNIHSQTASQQYVTLMNALNYLKVEKVDIAKVCGIICSVMQETKRWKKVEEVPLLKSVTPVIFCA
ncbi:hypothetical protein K474DRAFT_1673584 [Panus rudis PR-1116 ss-1]|nr:hypothetical protein K474DRAFT_1673584 [Panus rudis PR-1116 ss-1]